MFRRASIRAASSVRLIGRSARKPSHHAIFESHLVQISKGTYPRPGSIRGVEAMDNSYRLLDLTVYGRQEMWEDSPTGWPQRFEGKQNFRIDRRPTAQWSRQKAGHSDDLITDSR
jgi:predicted dithiol-disulfide oxidoreductase (DUF899 family)